MITRKARFYLVKYTKENGFTGSLVITTTEESAKDIIKEYAIQISIQGNKAVIKEFKAIDGQIQKGTKNLDKQKYEYSIIYNCDWSISSCFKTNFFTI